MRFIISVLALTLALPAFGQITAVGPVVNGHHHYNAGDVEQHMHFWVDALGGRRGTFANGAPIVFFPNALIFMRDQDPTAGQIGSTVNHVGFSVRDLRATVDKVLASGFRMITDTEAPAGVEVVDNIGIVTGGGPVSGIAYAEGPDGIKVEILEMKSQAEPIVSHHIHFFGEDAEAMRAWYIDTFGAVERPGVVNGIISADLPGLGLSFTGGVSGVAPTEGRVLDHIGFEIDNLKAFTESLEARGIPLTVPYREAENLGLAIAFVTDPWGTRIELTEGLDKLR